MIVYREKGHAYENIPVTAGFHEIPTRCYICGAKVASDRLTGSSRITGAGGFSRMPPPSDWSSQPPVGSGWYWYKHLDTNEGKPTAAWVFCNAKTLHVSMFLTEGETSRQEIGRPEISRENGRDLWSCPHECCFHRPPIQLSCSGSYDYPQPVKQVAHCLMPHRTNEVSVA